MTAWRSCVGCDLQGKPCEARDAMRGKLQGLGVTSIKWRCASRKPRFAVGDLAWARTVDGGQVSGDEGEPTFDDFPAVVIRLLGTAALVFIPQGAPGRGEDCTFSTIGNGFCKIPLSRLTERDGPVEAVCKWCEMPASRGHIEGYSCHYQARTAESEVSRETRREADLSPRTEDTPNIIPDTTVKGETL